MTKQNLNVETALAELKDFQRRTARWAFERMFGDDDPTPRFLVADEVGLGKTHVAKGVIAQVIDHLRHTGDKRHDIVYICSNAAIARQNIRKLAPPSIKPLDHRFDRLTMLPLAKLDEGSDEQTGVNLLAITPGTSLKFGRSTGWFQERCLAYTFLRAHWGRQPMRTARARRIFWEGVTPEAGDRRLREREREYRPRVVGSLDEFARTLDETDHSRVAEGRPTVRALFDQLIDDMPKQRRLPYEVRERRKDLIGAVRTIMAQVGIARLSPDLVILDEFQRFKDLLHPEPDNFAAQLAHRLFDHRDPETGQATRTLMLSATPYRMYTTADDTDDNHYADFLDTCSFLFGHDSARVGQLQARLRSLRTALTSGEPISSAGQACRSIEGELRNVMVRTERLAATPDRDGMLQSADVNVDVKPADLSAYLRLAALAEAVDHHEPIEYWKSGPYLVNFMEHYKLKQAVVDAMDRGGLGHDPVLDPGPGLLKWNDVKAYRRIDPENGRLRWLLADLERHRAFELLWIPASMRYYDTGSAYESPEASAFTKRLIFSGWQVVPKVVSSLLSFEAERRAYRDRSHTYSAGYRHRGGQRLTFRTTERTAQRRPGETSGPRRAAAMTAFLLTWPSPSLARIGDPRLHAPGISGAGTSGEPSQVSDVLNGVAARLANALEPLLKHAPADGVVDQRWYWAAPLFLDQQRTPAIIDMMLGPKGAWYWDGDNAGKGLLAHIAEARAMIDHGPGILGRPPADLVEVLAELAVGGPAQCALRMISSVCGLPVSADEGTVEYAAWIAGAFRSFFNSPEVTAVIAGGLSEQPDVDDSESRYWRDVVRHSIGGNLQAVLDEHGHVLRDWLGHLSLGDDGQRWAAACDIAGKLAEALELRTSSYRVDIPARERNAFDQRRMRTRFAVAFGNQALDGGGEARIESVSRAFNSPFWPFVLTSTSIGQEGLDFHLWCHAVVHWNLPSNPVDLEQREGRVHRYKGHAVRRNIAETLGAGLLATGPEPNVDIWDALFAEAAAQHPDTDEMVPYWVFNKGRHKIERHVPALPFSREWAALPKLRKTLAAYRLAFGQPRQEELLEFLGAQRSEAELAELVKQLRIDLSPHTAPSPSAPST